MTTLIDLISVEPATLWRDAEPFLAPALASPADRARIAALTQSFPAPVRCACLECPLDGSSSVDLSFEVSAERFAACFPHVPCWPELQTADPVFLEYDLSGAASNVPAAFWPLGVAVAERERLREPLNALANPPVSEAALAFLASLAPETRINYLAVMSSRPGRPVRLNLSGVNPPAVPPALPITALIAAADHCVYAFDLDANGIRPRWGVELFLRNDADGAAKWRGLFERLVALGLAKTERLAATSAWPAMTPRLEQPMIGRFLGLELCDWRAISHLKLVIDGEAVTAKIYLIWGPRWRTPGMKRSDAGLDLRPK